MLYQLNVISLPLVLLLDVFALFFLYWLVRIQQQFTRIAAYAAALLFVVGTTFIKLICSTPAFLASSPGDLHIDNDTGRWFQTFYYLNEDDAGQPYAYWREYIFGPRKMQTLEMEEMRSLLVAKKIDGEWRYQRISPTSMLLKLADAHFQPDTSGRIAKAVHAQQWLDLGSSYLSELLTLAVLFLMVYRLPALRKRSSGESYVNLLPAT